MQNYMTASDFKQSQQAQRGKSFGGIVINQGEGSNKTSI